MSSSLMKTNIIKLLTILNGFKLTTHVMNLAVDLTPPVPIDVLECKVPLIEGIMYAKKQGFLTLPVLIKTFEGEFKYILYLSGGPHTGDIYRLKHPSGYLSTIYIQNHGIPHDMQMYRAIEDTLHRIEHEYLQEAKLYLKDNT